MHWDGMSQALQGAFPIEDGPRNHESPKAGSPGPHTDELGAAKSSEALAICAPGTSSPHLVQPPAAPITMQGASAQAPMLQAAAEEAHIRNFLKSKQAPQLLGDPLEGKPGKPPRGKPPCGLPQGPV